MHITFRRLVKGHHLDRVTHIRWIPRRIINIPLTEIEVAGPEQAVALSAIHDTRKRACKLPLRQIAGEIVSQEVLALAVLDDDIIKQRPFFLGRVKTNPTIHKCLIPRLIDHGTVKPRGQDRPQCGDLQFVLAAVYQRFHEFLLTDDRILAVDALAQFKHTVERDFRRVRIASVLGPESDARCGDEMRVGPEFKHRFKRDILPLFARAAQPDFIRLLQFAGQQPAV